MNSMQIDLGPVLDIPGLKRTEITSKDEMGGLMSQLTHAVYPHDELYGQYCPIQAYINCPPEKVFEYMANPLSLEEWSYSVRDLVPSEIPGVLVGRDRIGDNTKIYCKV